MPPPLKSVQRRAYLSVTPSELHPTYRFATTRLGRVGACLLPP